ncbi:helix-turn-helix domain-containing protein [Paenibacillus sp. 8b26]|uniref:helix-turn-helix domain-containing protein n=1 Tax=Paenibacillus sp. 8b26 TaxID=3424133 RepID=UPI003D653891
MEWLETIRLWTQMPVKVLDIRHFTMKSGERLSSYSLPSSGFLFANQGEARLMLDGIETSSAKFQVLHGGKGANLNIWCLNQPFEYYLILYKPVQEQAGQSPFEREDRMALFRQNYAFQALYPLPLISLVEQMNQQWSNRNELDKLQVNGLFYQFVHEHFRQLQMKETKISEPDLATQIAQYIQKHFQKPIAMEKMAKQFHYSTHYLVKVFKRKYGCSPIEYVVQTRINRAKSLLAETDASIREVAENVGYTNFYYFSRLFKKQTGETPTQFKMHSLVIKSSTNTNFTLKSFIAPGSGQRYIGNNDNHYQHDAWRVDDMNVSFKPAFAVTLLFSLTLLLAACSGTSDVAKPIETRSYTDVLGRKMEIPVQPKRAVVITYGGYLLPLGLKPIGVNQEILDLYPDKMADVASIGKGTGNVEAISALEPDLIILSDFHDKATFEQYQKIAPTIAVAWGGDPDVVNTLRTFGDIMNRKTEAESWIAKFEKKLQGIREQTHIPIKADTTAISFIIYKGEVLLGGEGGTLGKLIYQDFGFQMPEQFKPYADGGTALSMEALVHRPADYFFTQMTDQELKQTMQLFSEPVYQIIPAVKNKHIINVSRDKWNNGPYLVDEAVDSLIEQISQIQP